MLQFRVLGSLDLRGPEGEEILSVLSQPKRIALLSYLAVATPRGFHRRDKLVGLFWPDLDQDRARAALRKSLHHLRQSLGEEVVLRRGDEEVSLNWDLFRLDVAGFEESLEERPEEALDLYRGHLLDGFFLAGCTEFDRWAEGERERVRKAAAGAAWVVAHRFVAAGLPMDGERMAQRALALMPTDEAEVRRFIEALARAGDRAAAVQFYEKFAGRLQEELELRPDAESRELVERIRDSIQLPLTHEEGRGAPGWPAEPEAGPSPPTPESFGTNAEVADPTAQFERFKSSIADRYEIDRELGRGGMATVYLAKDLKHDRQVALKVMRSELSAILGGERFLREIRIAAKLNHPHILALYDSGSAGGILYYVMPFVEGESLRAKLDRERELSVDETVTIARQVASALDHAHEKGIVHRDIKPENILIHQGEALVSDFGIAVAVSVAGSTRLTGTGLSLGTPEYMSPEQATGERQVDARSDLYSLGAVVYEMLVGEPPHLGKTVQSILAKVVSAEPQPVSAVRQSVPYNVDAAVMCALAKTPADRFSSGAEFSEALASPGRPDVASVRLAHRPFSRRGVFAWLVGVVGVGAVATGVFRGLISSPGGGPSDLWKIAVLPCENRTGDPEQEYIAAGVYDEVLSGLGEIFGVEVRGRSSATRYRGTDKSFQDIARELGVGGLVDCSVYPVGDSIGIRVSFLDVSQDRQLWSRPYQRAPDNVFLLGSDITLGLAEALGADPTSSDTDRVEAQPSESQEALTHYYRGRLLLNQWTGRGLRRSIEYFQDAIRLDPTFALAYLGIAEATLLLGDVIGLEEGISMVENMPEVRELVQQALDLDDGLSDAHRLLGWIRWYHDFDYVTGEREARLATTLDPTNAGAWAYLGLFLGAVGRFEDGIAAYRRAVELDPAEPWIISDFSWVLVNAREYEEALLRAEESIELDPDRTAPYIVAGDALLLLGRDDEALGLYERARGMSPDPWYRSRIGVAHAKVGNQEEVLRILEGLKENREEEYVSPRAFVTLYMALDSLEQAIDWAIEAAKDKDPGAQWEVRHPFNDKLRDHRRYPELLSFLGLGL